MFKGLVSKRGNWWVAAPLVVACGDDVRVSADRDWPDELDVAFIELDDRGHISLATAAHMPDSAETLPGEYDTRHLGWSPCGDEIAMQTGTESTQLVTVSAGDSRVVADLWMAYTGFQVSSGPWWSPDGRYIAAIGAVNVGVGVVPTCGWGEHLYVCEVSTRECRDVDRVGTAVEHRTGAQWSPASDSILAIRQVTTCTTDAADGESVEAWTVIAHDVDGADVHMPLGGGEPLAAAWSPTDDRVVVAVERDAGPALLLWHPSSGDTEVVATAFPSARQIAWLPDASQWLLVTATDPPSLFTLDAASGERIDVRAGLSDIVVAPDGRRAFAVDHGREQHVLLDLGTRAATPVPGDRHWWRPRCAAE